MSGLSEVQRLLDALRLLGQVHDAPGLPLGRAGYSSLPDALYPARAFEEADRAGCIEFGRLREFHDSLGWGMSVAEIREQARREAESAYPCFVEWTVRLTPRGERAVLLDLNVSAIRTIPDEAIVNALRQAIAKLGSRAKAGAIIQEAQVAPAKGRRGLRFLETLGEYNGFARKRSARYGM
jgi:hypothetical protein